MGEFPWLNFIRKIPFSISIQFSTSIHWQPALLRLSEKIYLSPKSIHSLSLINSFWFTIFLNCSTLILFFFNTQFHHFNVMDAGIPYKMLRLPLTDRMPHRKNSSDDVCIPFFRSLSICIHICVCFVGLNFMFSEFFVWGKKSRKRRWIVLFCSFLGWTCGFGRFELGGFLVYMFNRSFCCFFGFNGLYFLRNLSFWFIFVAYLLEFCILVRLSVLFSTFFYW